MADKRASVDSDVGSLRTAVYVTADDLLLGDRRTPRERHKSGGRNAVRPAERTLPGRGPHLAPIRHRVESISWSRVVVEVDRAASVRTRCRMGSLGLGSIRAQPGRLSRALVDYRA
jgi:hypothetical protein